MVAIDKLALLYITDRKVLYARSRGKELFYVPGGKRDAGETDQQALMREIREELNVHLVSETIEYLQTFKAQAHGKPEGTLVEIKAYKANFDGTLAPTSEIEELAWFASTDSERTSLTGKLILDWLKENNLID